MKTTSNKDMLNAIRNQASAEYQERMPAVTSDDGIMMANLQDKLFTYPTIKNEFINTLVNKVIRTDFFSRVYSNPLTMLKQGSMPYGGSIEQLFVMAAEAKGFYTDGNLVNENAEIRDTQIPNELLYQEKPNIKALYITKNFAHYFKTSISDAQLKAAFTSQNGLSELVNQISASLVNGAEQKEYKDMILLLKAAAQNHIPQDTKGLISDQTVQIPAASGSNENTVDGDNTLGVSRVMKKHYIDVAGAAGKTFGRGGEISKAIRALAGRMKFVSKDYNMAGVKTWCQPEDLVFLTTPEIMAELDVDVLAQAFNVSNADVIVRTILVDELPTKFAKGKQSAKDKTKNNGYWFAASGDFSSGTVAADKVYGILMDKNFIKVIDTLNEARTFDNGRSLTTNLFLHKQGMLANCYFANCVALIDKDQKTQVDPVQ